MRTANNGWTGRGGVRGGRVVNSPAVDLPGDVTWSWAAGRMSSEAPPTIISNPSNALAGNVELRFLV